MQIGSGQVSDGVPHGDSHKTVLKRLCKIQTSFDVDRPSVFASQQMSLDAPALRIKRQQPLYTIWSIPTNMVSIQTEPFLATCRLCPLRTAGFHPSRGSVLLCSLALGATALVAASSWRCPVRCLPTYRCPFNPCVKANLRWSGQS